MLNRFKISVLVLVLGIFGLLFTAGPAFAQTNENSTRPYNMMGRSAHMYGVLGKVTSISGNTLTVTGNTSRDGSSPVYTVDATNARVTKNGVVGTISSIAIGDVISVRGPFSGTNIKANVIKDGVAPNPLLSLVKGNGQPVVAGTVTAISGKTLTITNQSNVTYSVDTSNANIIKSKATSTLSSIATGDKVVVQGTVNGTSIVSSSVIDQGQATTTSGQVNMGFFGGMRNFFARIFGF